MSFANPNETWEEAEARWAANRAQAIRQEADLVRKSQLEQADLSARLTADFLKLFERTGQ